MKAQQTRFFVNKKIKQLAATFLSLQLARFRFKLR